MSQATVELPEVLKPYATLGIKFLSVSSAEATAECPYCAGIGKFSVRIEGEKAGTFRCNKCDEHGNVYGFMQFLHKTSLNTTPAESYVELAHDRHLLSPETLKVWGVAQSFLTLEWVVPGYNYEGKLNALYRYVPLKQTDGTYKKRLILPPGISHGVSGPDIPIPVGGVQATKVVKTGPIYRVEGLWDAMALWEVLGQCRKDNGVYVPTSNAAASLLSQGSVISVPGATIFNENWTRLWNGRPDYSFYDNDHPKKNPRNGKTYQAALDGSKKVVGILARCSEPPKDAKYLQWGENTYHDPSLKHGYDIRDHLSAAGNTLLKRIQATGELLDRLKPVPKDWYGDKDGSTSTGLRLSTEPCTEWAKLKNAGRLALDWTEGIELTFVCMLATTTLIEQVGDQLWLTVIGPPSSGKSTLCEALSTNRTYVLPKDTLTGIVSGFQTDKEGSENMSLAGQLNNKALVIKDADTLLQSPALLKILSQLRTMYDRALRTSYGNKMSVDYEGLNTGVILCGTATLLSLDSADRGARFLTVDIQPFDDREQQRATLRRVIRRAITDVRTHSNGTMESRDSEEIVDFKKLTGGYIDYLRSNAIELINNVTDALTDNVVDTIGNFAEFISYMRCRPPKTQDEKVEREMPYRLGSQLTRLAVGIAVVMNKKTVDNSVLQKVKQVAFHTAKGKIMTLCDAIRSCGEGGADVEGLSIVSADTVENLRKTLKFLQTIGAVERRRPGIGSRFVQSKLRWYLSPIVSELYDSVVGPMPEESE